MIVQDLIAALELPASSRVDQRIPKKLLVENGAPTTADKRNINEGIEAIQWLASLKPSTIGVPEYRDEIREYLEIAVLEVTLRQDAKASRLTELIHRAIPYPVVLMQNSEEGVTLSLTHIRWAQNEAGKVVLDGELVAAALHGRCSSPDIFPAFLQALSITRQPRASLKVLYQGWLDTLAAYQAAQITGVFALSKTDVQAAARRANLLACRELEQQITTLMAAAIKEKQLARQVALNLEIKQLQAKQQQAVSDL